MLLGLALAYAGMAGLCLAMDRHHRQVWHRAAGAPTRLGFRMVGWLLIGLSLACNIGAQGWSIGVPAWAGMLSVAGLALVLLLSYAPRLAALLASMGPTLAAMLRLTGI